MAALAGGYSPAMTTLPTAESMGFGPLRIAFDGRVLRPRPWTEAQATWAAEILETAPPGAVLELCAGAGQIGLLAVVGSTRPLVCVDVNPAACEWARHNAEAAGHAPRVAGRAGPKADLQRDSQRFAQGVAPAMLQRGFALFDYPEDPVIAIDGGDDGMDLAWLCVDVARHHLAPLGTLLLQLGTVEQVDALRARLHDDDFVITEVRWCDRGVLVRLDLT